MRDHGGAMIIIRVFMLLSFMLQLQIWMQLTVLMLLLKVILLIILIMEKEGRNRGKRENVIGYGTLYAMRRPSDRRCISIAEF